MKTNSLKLLRNILLTTFTVLLFIASRVAETTSGPPTGNTNAPGESNCTGCHSGSLVTSGTNWSNIKISSTITANGYVPDSTYTFTISYTQSGIVKYGFEGTILFNSNNTKAGTLIVTDATNTRLRTGTRDYIEQTTTGSSAPSGTVTWQFNWQAPPTNAGSVTLYLCFMATNNNSSSSGDITYAKTLVIPVSNLLPTSVISTPDSTICVGDTLYLLGGGANNPTSFTWSMPLANPSSSTLKNPKTVYSAPGTYKVYLTTANNKATAPTDSQNIYVYAKPTASITASGPTTFCQGDSVTLTANSGTGYTYLWSNGKTTRSISAKTSGIYTVTVTNPSFCSANSTPVSVTVNPLPIVTLVSSVPNDSICTGTPVTFTASPGLTNYKFMNGTTLLRSDTTRIYSTSTLSSGNDIYVIGTNSNGCVGQSNHIVTKVFTRIARPAVICGPATTNSVIFQWSSVTGATGYQVSRDTGKTWIPPSSGILGLSHTAAGLTYNQGVLLLARTVSTKPCNYSIPDTAICYATGCSPVTFTLVYKNTICNGDSVYITVKNISVKKYSLNFDNKGFTKDTVFLAKPTSTRSYNLILTDSTSPTCPPVDLHPTITVLPRPTVTLTSSALNDTICEGTLIRFTAMPGLSNYKFMNGSTLLTNDTQHVYSTTTLTPGNDIFVIGTNLQGCSSSSNHIRTVIVPAIKPPVVTCGTATTTSVTFQWTAVTNATGYEISTDTGKTWHNPSSGHTGLTHTISGLGYYQQIMLLVRTDGNHPCNFSVPDTQICHTLMCSPVKFTLEYKSTICLGDSVIIYVKNLNTKRFSINFNSHGYRKDTIFVIRPPATTTYTMLLFDSTMMSCPPVDLSPKITVNPAISASLKSNLMTNAICYGTLVRLAATNGFIKYTFIRNNHDTMSSVNDSVFQTRSIQNHDDIFVIVENSTGCRTNTNHLLFTVYDLPNAGFIYTQNFMTFNFSDTTKNSVNWLWNFGDNNIAYKKQPTYTYSTAGFYHVVLTVTDSNGCTDTAGQVVHAIPVGISHGDVAGEVKIYSSGNQLYINYFLTDKNAVTIDLIDPEGRQIRKVLDNLQSPGEYKIRTSLEDLKAGLYIVRFIAGERIEIKRVFKY